ncbi:tubulin alpha chain, partial [Reticulomyxa filosa]
EIFLLYLINNIVDVAEVFKNDPFKKKKTISILCERFCLVSETKKLQEILHIIKNTHIRIYAIYLNKKADSFGTKCDWIYVDANIHGLQEKIKNRVFDISINILSTSIVWPYNVLLAVSSLFCYDDITLVFDNKTICNMCQMNMHIAKPDVNNINRLVAKAILSMTILLRLDRELHNSLNELQASLISL